MTVAALIPRKENARNEAVPFIVGGSEGDRRIEVTEPRVVQILKMLVERGLLGVTPLDLSGVRVAASVFKLRMDYAIPIETVTERHGGRYAGTYGRYVLRADVRPVDREAA
ncbi:hypothetical protein [Minwuia sp. IMCC3077]|uniref:winged helix domain-containing protein n=1 Tax=Minwuia sp. IMCC3077 TaxID=3040676 RepID=UPI0024797D25|nr:hypothetical protein [Minwuia sp. IMCC3077]